MLANKIKILWVGEATFLSTGYSTYGKEILSRLHSTGKYEIAELGIFGSPYDKRRLDIPWKYYGNLPESQALEEEYASQVANKFGLWRFEEVVLDFKPDIVISISDWWMFEYIERSPFRHFFNWIIMPAIDSSPQPDQWISTYKDADLVLAYCEFGKEEMERKSVNVSGIASPAADYSIFFPPKNKAEIKKSLGIMPDTRIVGTVMRNQRRKLYPDLFQTFRDYCIEYPSLSKNTFLYAHTAYPDIGWNIPELIKRYDIGHKTLFTYSCRDCGHFFPSFFHDAVQACPKCKKPSARMPDPDHGLSPANLAKIVQSFDIYVQYSSAGGFEMPIVEAAACGVPTMAVDYSAMASVIRNVGGVPIKVLHLNLEPEGHYYRAIPDNPDCKDKIFKLLNMSEADRHKFGLDMYKDCHKFYDWDKTSKVWESAINKVIVNDRPAWTSPAKLVPVEINIPNNMHNEQFVRFCISHIWGHPEKENSYLALRMMRDLNYGKAMTGHGGIHYNEMSTLGVQQYYSSFTRKNVIDELSKLANISNEWEQKRCGISLEYTPVFIKLANQDMENK